MTEPDVDVRFLEAQLEAMATLDTDALEVLEQLASVIFPERTGYGDPRRTVWPERRPNGEESSGEAGLRRRLERMEHRLFTLVEQLPAVVFLAALGEDENEVYVSPQVERLLGFTQSEWLNNPLLWYQQLHPDDHQKVIDAFTHGIHTGGPFRAEVRFFTRDGRTVWILGEAQLIRDEAGRPEYFQGIGFDVTASREAQDLVADAERRRANELAAANEILQRLNVELEQAKAEAEEAAAARGTFLATMSHELRTPMNSVLVLAELLGDTDLDETQQEMLGSLGVAASHLLSLINDVLDYSRMRAGRFELITGDVDVASWVGTCLDIVEPSAADKGLHLAYRFEGDVPRKVIADEGRLRQVLLNLLGNAVKFTPAGTIEVVVAAERIGDQRWRLTCSVHDTGVGIAAADLDAVFGEFTQADSGAARAHEGTGLGLSISRSLVELMGGTMGVTSELGSGTTFWFTWKCDEVPADRAATPTTAPRAASAPTSTPLRPLRVLLAEDNEMNRRVATLLLDAIGYEADAVADGAEAIDAVTQQAYDVVLMDMMMPGTDGLTATRRIRERGDTIHQPYVIALTANALPGDREACLEAGMDDYISKPIDRAALTRALAVAGAGRPAAPAPGPRVDPPSSESQAARELRALYGPENLAHLVRMFQANAASCLHDMRTAFAATDPAGVRLAAHTLKAGAATLGASALADACTAIEHEARLGALSGVSASSFDAIEAMVEIAARRVAAIAAEG